MKFKIYRYNPDTDAAPYMRDYDLDIEAGNTSQRFSSPQGMMLLDALLSSCSLINSSASSNIIPCGDENLCEVFPASMSSS